MRSSNGRVAFTIVFMVGAAAFGALGPSTHTGRPTDTSGAARGPEALAAALSAAGSRGEAQPDGLQSEDYYTAVDIAPPYLYVLYGARLLVMDVSHPSAPRLLGTSSALLGSPRGLAAGPGVVYVASAEGGLRVVDVSDPTAPREVYAVAAESFVSSVGTVPGYVLVADENDLRFLSTADRLRPVEAHALRFADPVDLLHAGSGYAYVFVDDSGLTVLDVRDPLSPEGVYRLDTGDGSVTAAHGAADYAFAATTTVGLVAIDVRDPGNVHEVGRYSLEGRVADLWAADVSDPSAPRVLGTARLPSSPWGVRADGHLVYVADGDSGLRIFDVAKPAAPKEVGRWPTRDGSNGLDVALPYAFVADNSGLEVVDVSDPSAPTLAGWLDTPGASQGVKVDGPYACVINGSGGLWIVDVSDPAAPREVSAAAPPARRRGTSVAVAGHRAYVGDDLGGLTVVDVTDPTAPRVAATVSLPDAVGQIVVRDSVVYVVTESDGLLMYAEAPEVAIFLPAASR
jgi:hypothetical protein